ncbi:hypothetical protein [Alicyclobacillus sp. ALC3]|uniref:hypothetical protein n=1 Tax=Alicyclobacillus sp. ALC3 TaxID=2796143 RepID=UPI002378F547|nr:hypothetical protein [Alicyclobacillus sp. ALC3]WDL97214.1 hypothetical protein JC200_00155 [Alicyclobacillus sp. ALC3]
MRYSHLTPRQFRAVSKYVDTVYVTTYSTHSLDAAIPQACAQWIAEDITEQVEQRFSGRVASVEAGAILEASEFSPTLLARFEDRFDFPVHGGVLLSDRMFRSERLEMVSDYKTPWVVLDWWQWLHSRVDETRLADAWMFLAHAHHTYPGSREHRSLGLEQHVATEMTRQGQTLLQRLVDWNDTEIHTLWNSLTHDFSPNSAG